LKSAAAGRILIETLKARTSAPKPGTRCIAIRNAGYEREMLSRGLRRLATQTATQGGVHEQRYE
jgi:hypothetical protein